MKHLFIPYELAVIAKEKGFNEPCLAKYGMNSKSIFWCKEGTITTNELLFCEPDNALIAAPLYQQIIDWLLKTHKFGISIHYEYQPDWKTNEVIAKLDKAIFIDTTTKEDLYKSIITGIELAFKLIP